jgi:ABC-2 type transport system ATP-binding protein
VPVAAADSSRRENDEVIRTEGLTKVFPGGVKAVDHLDLSLNRGEIFGLLGPNGAGKTTTVGMLTSMVVPTEGEASVGGVDVIAHPALAKQGIGVVPQTNTLDRSLSVWENLYFHGRFFGMSSRDAKTESTRLLERFLLADRASAEVLALSGGMAQRLMVARAVMHRPAILFLDEPTAGLDPQGRIALWQILRELHTEGQTILLTTHYMEEADQQCDRVAIMDHGRILDIGTVEELVGRRFRERTVRFGAVDAIGDAQLASLPGVSRVNHEDGEVVLHTADVPATIGGLLDAATAAGTEPANLMIRRATLEDVFLELTGRALRD